MLNQCILTGNLGDDPSSHYTPEGLAIANFNIAFKSSAKKKDANWIKVSCFGKLAEISSTYLHKGARIAVVGVLDQNKWQGDDGHRPGGLFIDIGDANPLNCNSKVAKHIIRMASTRAKARCLRDLTNIGMTALEELGDINEVIGAEYEAGKMSQPKKDNIKKFTPKPARAVQQVNGVGRRYRRIITTFHLAISETLSREIGVCQKLPSPTSPRP